MLTLLALSLVPFISFWMFLGFVIIFFVVLILIIRWQIKFGRLQTGDIDYQRARSLRNVAMILWVAAVPLFVARDILVEIIALAFQ